MSRRRRAPGLGEVAAKLAEARRLTRSVHNQYQWAVGFAYGSSRRVGIGSSSAAAEQSDPASGPVLSERKESVRERMVRASELVEDALANLRAAMTALDRGFGRGDAEQADAPPTVTKAERRALLAAQRRRLERGEGWGEA